MSPEDLAAHEGFAHGAERRKRLGQYLSGVRLARLLAALACAGRARWIIDPMAGEGDMLQGCFDVGAKHAARAGIEIDPVAHHVLAAKHPKIHAVFGNAFVWKTFASLSHTHWDLVITNPPYVRYQSIARASGNSYRLPDAVEVRDSLQDLLSHLPDFEDRALFGALAKGYSGLSDLAVPSWILCASLVKTGGRLALVAPESWLNREYATVVQYLLLRCFDIEYIVEDEHAAWFTDAQVKTTLIVARRVPTKPSAFAFDAVHPFLRVRLSRAALGNSSLIEHLRWAQGDEQTFAKKCAALLRSGGTYKDDMLEITPGEPANVAGNLRARCLSQEWILALDDAVSSTAIAGVIPAELADWLRQTGASGELTPLEGGGICVGQGLRTGANGVFYAESVGRQGDCEILETPLTQTPATVPSFCVMPVVRDQSDLPTDGCVIKRRRLRGRVLALQTCALAEDIRSGGKSAQQTYTRMPEGLARVIRLAANTTYNGKKVRQLSAVVTNARVGDLKTGRPPRFWYMLPPFMRRHRPDILLPRVNNGLPRAFLNPGKPVLVDANFSTIWLTPCASADPYGVLALLNSAWGQAALELSGAVMGGGALKLDASHLRHLPIPRLSRRDWRTLSNLGKDLASGSTSALPRLNQVVLRRILGRQPSETDLDSLRDLAEKHRRRRAQQPRGKNGQS